MLRPADVHAEERFSALRRFARPGSAALALGAAGAATALATLGLLAAGADGLVAIGAAALAFAASAGALGAHMLNGAGRAEPAKVPAEEGALRLAFDSAGEVAEASGAAPDLLTLPNAVLLGTGFFDRLHVADRVAFLCAQAAIREGGASDTLPVRLRLPKGDGPTPPGYRTLSLSLRMEGEALCGTLRDKSEVEQLEAALAEARETAREAEKRRGAALAAAGHELRTPLNAIIGFSEMLGRESLGGFSDPRQRDYAELIRQSGLHLMAVVDGILQTSMVEAGAYSVECKPFSFAEAVERARAMMGFAADSKGVRLVCEVPAACGVLRGDQRAVQQILINLLSNAVKYTASGGEVRVGAQRMGSRLHFFVRDTGVGIAAEDLSRIGKPFVRVGRTEATEGCGLGLSLVRTLVEAQGGTLSVESTPGEGTLVTVGLPVDLSQHSRKTEVANGQGADTLALRKTA
ncbi:MAG: PAS domain-containing sensor histidine kinase [Mesorhizobium amorphae]|nr:MAG: PAS domain-containing sensor histidine kinase [Mesorhizobium amorphae]